MQLQSYQEHQGSFFFFGLVLGLLPAIVLYLFLGQYVFVNFVLTGPPSLVFVLAWAFLFIFGSYKTGSGVYLGGFFLGIVLSVILGLEMLIGVIAGCAPLC